MRSPKAEWQDLIESYNLHNQFIKSQKRKWLPPPIRKGIEMKPKDQAHEGAVLPKKKISPDSPKKLSHVMEVMKAVSKAAQAPGKKKKSKIPSGPSKANISGKKQRIDKGDGPSAEEKGEA